MTKQILDIELAGIDPSRRAPFDMIIMDSKREREAAHDGRRRVGSQKRYLLPGQGYEALPGPLALGEISKEARTKLWDLLADSAWEPPLGRPHGSPLVRWEPIFLELHLDFLKLTKDEFTANNDKLYGEYRALILDSLPFNKVFDLFQMVMRHSPYPPTFTTDVAEIFVRCRLAYVVDIKKPATILPAATKQEGEVIVEAIGEFREAGLHGPEAHLRKAAALINSGDWPGAIRESTHAVESVARQLAPDASSTLGPALTSLEKTGRLHPALKKAFSNPTDTHQTRKASAIL